MAALLQTVANLRLTKYASAENVARFSYLVVTLFVALYLTRHYQLERRLGKRIDDRVTKLQNVVTEQQTNSEVLVANHRKELKHHKSEHESALQQQDTSIQDDPQTQCLKADQLEAEMRALRNQLTKQHLKARVRDAEMNELKRGIAEMKSDLAGAPQKPSNAEQELDTMKKEFAMFKFDVSQGLETQQADLESERERTVVAEKEMAALKKQFAELQRDREAYLKKDRLVTSNIERDVAILQNGFVDLEIDYHILNEERRKMADIEDAIDALRNELADWKWENEIGLNEARLEVSNTNAQMVAFEKAFIDFKREIEAALHADHLKYSNTETKVEFLEEEYLKKMRTLGSRSSPSAWTNVRITPP